MSKKILITGAAGFIGSHLVELLLKEKEPISRLRLLIPEKESLINLPKKDFEIIRGDIRDKDFIKKAMQGVETVYHLAARVDFEGKSLEDYKDVNVLGTQNLLDECRGKNIQKFVFFSSIAVFGLPAEAGEIENWDEKRFKNPDNFYGQSKLEGEKIVLKAFDKWKIPFAIIRPASVYGPRETGPTLALYKAIKNHYFIMVGDGKNRMHYVYVSDLVKGARQAQKSKLKIGDYILAGPGPTTLQEVVRYISESLGMRVSPFYIPKSLALTLGYGMEFVGNLVGIKFPLYPSRVRTMTTTYYYNIQKAKKEIGYRPKIDFKEGTKIMSKWFLESEVA